MRRRARNRSKGRTGVGKGAEDEEEVNSYDWSFLDPHPTTVSPPVCDGEHAVDATDPRAAQGPTGRANEEEELPPVIGRS
jgi:hypothetical protein